MDSWTNEIGLALTLLLNAAVLAAAFAFTRRQGGGGMLQAACDALLIYFVVQYAAVALPGAVGMFNVWTMSAVALLPAAGMAWRLRRGSAHATAPACRRPLTADHLTLISCAVFVVAYLVAHGLTDRWRPPLITDALVYHLPTAVQWIQTGRLGLYPTWYWNPAATYSPATSSTFMAWLMAPTGNDVFVRFVQGPPLVLIFLLVARLCRVLGCSRAVAGLIAAAAAMSRPLFSEALAPKDDLFITAFFAAAVLSLTTTNLRDRLGPWRVGLCFGMVLASKYTVLLACPLFLFMADAPLRARWRLRDWLIALTTGAILFAPWYVRNVVLTGNPLFPVDVTLFGRRVFTGLFGTERDQQLRTAAGVWRMLADTYHSIPIPLLALLGVGWLAGLFRAGRDALRDPLTRACLIGTPLTIAIFLLTSPHHEVRYVYPLLPLLFAGGALAINRWIPSESLRISVSALVALVSLGTAFDVGLMLTNIPPLLAPAAMVTLAGVALVLLQARVMKLPRGQLAIATLVPVLIGAMVLYVNWSLWLRTYYRKTDEGVAGQAGVSFAWQAQYPQHEPLWTFVRDHVPDDATLAVANTFFVYPFYDARYHRRVTHAPVRRGLHDFRDFPRMGETVPGDLIVQRMTEVMNEDADESTWLENLRRCGAEYVVMGILPHEPDPPERRFVAKNPERFQKLFESSAGSVYRILPAS
jgi:hypothetical protein